MSHYLHTQAMTLNRRPYREDDRFFTFYTRNYGKISAVVHGGQKIKSKIAPHLEPFHLVDLLLVNVNQYKVIGAEIIKRHDSIQSHYHAIQSSQYYLSLVDKLASE